MLIKQRKGLSKACLKIFRKRHYKRYKEVLEKCRKRRKRQDALRDQQEKFEIAKRKLSENLRFINNSSVTELNFCHGGNSGDIIYSLAALRELRRKTGKKINFFLKLNEEIYLPENFYYPLGSVRMNDHMANLLIPLLSKQPYLNHCGVYEGQTIHIDLDFFRDGFIRPESGNIAKWYNYYLGVNPDLSRNWLNAPSDSRTSGTILIARSDRYRNNSIDYSFLNKYPNLLFVGIEREYESIKRAVKDIGWIQVKDFAELSSVISGCRFFIGNQSFPFAVAEALKVPRILELYRDAPNVLPQGNDGFDYYFQEHFEMIVEELYSRTGK